MAVAIFRDVTQCIWEIIINVLEESVFLSIDGSIIQKTISVSNLYVLSLLSQKDY